MTFRYLTMIFLSQWLVWMPPLLANCPKASRLIPPSLAEKRYFWSGPGGWQSTPSYSTHAVVFQGAQWKGTNVGKMICVYQMNEADSFPLTLQNNKIVRKPTTAHWKQVSENIDGSEITLLCRAPDVKQCPFNSQTVTGLPNAEFSPNANIQATSADNSDDKNYSDFEEGINIEVKRNKEQALDHYLNSLDSNNNQKNAAPYQLPPDPQESKDQKETEPLIPDHKNHEFPTMD